MMNGLGVIMGALGSVSESSIVLYLYMLYSCLCHFHNYRFLVSFAAQTLTSQLVKATLD